MGARHVSVFEPDESEMNRPKISFLTSGHLPYDDRIFWHMGKTLSEAGYAVEIVSSRLFLKDSRYGISLRCFEGNNLSKKAKIEYYIEQLSEFNPDIIICSEPLPVLAGNSYRKRLRQNAIIIYDITEWYPSRKNLSPCKPFLKGIIFIKLLIFNLVASFLSDAFIFGEWYKSKPYKLLFPFKQFLFLTYYPDLDLFSQTEPDPPGEKIRLLYSGRISIEKGFGNFIDVIRKLSEVHNNLLIEVKIVGWYESDTDREHCQPLLKFQNNNISIEIKGRMPLREFLSEINETDIFLDLRKSNFESRRSLPIRLFYFAALGRPVIFTDLKSIRREVEIENFGYLVNPDKDDAVANIISGYIKNKDLYFEHCRIARKLAEEKYNWQQISPAFIRFIESFPLA